ncbi:MAG TPA: MFS transporter [Verrucomicrobiae bacterium]|jgi:ACS family hexuronate transporter-like MFS transporter
MNLPPEPVRNRPSSAGVRLGHYRWVICALLFFAATINYIDRQVIGILKPALVKEFGWSDERIYSSIVFSFQFAYALGFMFAGRVMDTLGVRRGFALAIVLWSIAAMAHGAADWVTKLTVPVLNLDAKTGFAVVTLGGAAAGLALARFALGLGEAGNFPASIKTVAEWFPKKERALATGIFNSGTNVGALLAPLIVPWVAAKWGWQWAFVGTGLLGFLWLAWWLSTYRSPENHPRLSAAELAYIRGDPAEPAVKIPWRKLLLHRQTWAFAIGKFMTDPIWWLYLFWVPDFLNRQYGVEVSVAKMGPPLLTIYLIADIGSIGGGWLSSRLIKQGWTVNGARKSAMLISALCVTPIMFAASGVDKWTAILIISLAAAAHQGWSANLFTLTSDMFPRRAVGSVVGIGGMAGAVGGMFIAMLVGAVLQATGSYVSIFIIAGSTYVVALALIQLLVPKLKPAEINR